MAKCLIGLGSNVGDRAEAIRRAVELMDGDEQVVVAATSRHYHTRPVGGPADQADFLNAVALLETALTPSGLLQLLQEIERQLGHAPAERWDARVIDLDLLLYDQHTVETEQLVVPHPRMAFRRFVLHPAVEIAADMAHPRIGWSLAKLLKHLDEADDYVAITGPVGVGKTKLASEIRKSHSCRFISASLGELELAQNRRDQAGRALETEIELLQLRVQRLERCPEDADRHRPIVSDFWLQQSLVYANFWLSGRDLADFEAVLQASINQVMKAKLLVWLDAPSESWPIRDPVASWLRKDELERLRGELSRQATRPGRGPLLKLDATDPAWAVTELRAALQAMREVPG